MSKYQTVISRASPSGFSFVRGYILRLLLPVLLIACAPHDGWGQSPAEPHVLKAADYAANTYVPTTFRLLGKRPSQATATIEVTYSENYPQEAVAAFEFAASIWEAHLTSPIVIEVQADWVQLDERTLGSAGPTFIDADFPGAPVPNTWYPIALSQTLQGAEDPGITGADIITQFNSELDVNEDGVTDWHFGTEGPTPSDKYSFATVVLHELAHGLGFIGSFDVGENCPGGNPDFGCWGIPTSATNELLPVIYDRFTEDVNGVSMLNTNVYPNPSVILGDTIQGGNVLFDAPDLRLVNEGVSVNLYAPSNFEAGSSYSHLDEDDFPPGSINSLMTPALARGETIFTPGPATCGIMGAIGWPLGPECRAFIPEGTLLAFEAERRAEGDILITWRVQGAGEIERFIVERQYFNRGFAPIDTLTAVEGQTSYSTVFTPERPGTYAFRLKQVLEGGGVIVPGEGELGFATVTVPLEGEALVSAFPNPFAERTSVSVVVDDAQEVRIALFDALGREVTRLFDGRMEAESERQIAVEADGLAAGVYFIQVVGEEFREVIALTHF